ncbi:MAG: hypothetical protein ACI9HE_001826 [Planctomycetota bacterium]
MAHLVGDHVAHEAPVGRPEPVVERQFPVLAADRGALVVGQRQESYKGVVEEPVKVREIRLPAVQFPGVESEASPSHPIRLARRSSADACPTLVRRPALLDRPKPLREGLGLRPQLGLQKARVRLRGEVVHQGRPQRGLLRGLLRGVQTPIMASGLGP